MRNSFSLIYNIIIEDEFKFFCCCQFFISFFPPQALEEYVQEEGYSSEKYELLTNYPRRKLSELDMNLTLKDAGLYPQDTVFVQERWCWFAVIWRSNNCSPLPKTFSGIGHWWQSPEFTVKTVHGPLHYYFGSNNSFFTLSIWNFFLKVSISCKCDFSTHQIIFFPPQLLKTFFFFICNIL